MSAEVRARLVNLLAAGHIGRLNGIPGERLAQQMGMCSRDLRKAISDARAEGTAIVGTPETGYYIAQNPDELTECCQFLRRRALHSLSLEAKLRGIALPELLGQLHLPT